VLVSDFDFELPPELIAQAPPEQRGGARMMAVDRERGALRDAWFREFPTLLRAGDVLVLNNSRVIPARLFARLLAQRDSGEGRRLEVLLTEQIGEWDWRALVKPARKAPEGVRLTFEPDDGSEAAALEAEVTGTGEFGERQLRFAPVPDFFSRLDRLGHIPLPPYIRRPDAAADRERYQTVYAAERGSVAAPTAGLHFTPEILAAIRSRGVEVCFITLHVGLGTFQPVRVEAVELIQLHAERYTLPAKTATAVNAARAEGRRVVAAGTTTVRTLEHCAGSGKELRAHSGTTSMFIAPGYTFRIVSGLLTNFHLPQSTLLMLVSAFAGRERILAAYRHAIQERYRFFSYGDCMFIA
jgi:S-adenosylmethionine:tRNA ribosyltransferase-isomerase